jgi:hypothetical protein
MYPFVEYKTLDQSKEHITICSYTYNNVEQEIETWLRFSIDGTYTSTGFNEERVISWKLDDDGTLCYRHNENMSWYRWGYYEQYEQPHIISSMLHAWLLEIVVL